MSETRKSTHTRTSTRRPGIRLTREQTALAQETFFTAFASTANVRASCLRAGIDRATVRAWEEHDATFSFRYNEAKEEANDLIRAELWRRSMQGVEKMMVSAGKVVYHEGKPLTYREPSDRLLEFMARSRMPEFREKQQLDVSGDLTIKTEWGGGALLDGDEVERDRTS